MSSEDSDDEPLSVLSKNKKDDPDKFISDNSELSIEPVRKEIENSYTNDPSISISLSNKLWKPRNITLAVTERPADVWMCITDLNNSGPFSCLLCPQWYINRTKLMLHYILEHRKDYCGICRYFVENREVWIKHQEVHIQWPCSQCTKILKTFDEQQHHLSSEHSLIHCRLCHIRLQDNEEYDKHLTMKHRVLNVNQKQEIPWLFDQANRDKFKCLYCNNASSLDSFFHHYINTHQFTIRCVSYYICGRDLPFRIPGVNITQAFIETHLRDYQYYGYATNKISKITGISDPLFPTDAVKSEMSMSSDNDVDDKSSEKEENDIKIGDDDKVDKLNIDIKINTENIDGKLNVSENTNGKESDLSTYRGKIDFDITLVEVIVLYKCFYDYVERILQDTTNNLFPAISEIDYTDVKPRYTTTVDIICDLCGIKSQTLDDFTSHLRYKHSCRHEFMYSCRTCKSTFNNATELDNHIFKESAEFNDLWLCQFCDKEFEGRFELREHLSVHRTELTSENCYSPHLGFKCNYCPVLFWTEDDRELHHVDAHMGKYIDQYYQCHFCSEVFSDKVWFVHHHLKNHTSDAPLIFMFKCCICSLVLTSLVEIKKHFKETHPEARKHYCCLGTCLYRPFASYRSLRLHIKQKHEISGKGPPGAPVTKLQCTVCRCLLETLDEKKLHCMLAHPYHRGLECATCGASFAHKSALHAHRQVHDNALSVCKQCGKSFTKREAYREHIRIHEAPRYACSYCPRRFVTRSNLTRHERRHTGEKPFPCPHCPLMFSDRGAAASHAKIHSAETVRHKCTYCHQTFTNKTKLTYHMRKHTGENLVHCSMCDKAFTCGSSLREHMKIHGEKTNVDCPLCERTYTNKSTMMKHLRARHADSPRVCPLCGRTFNHPTSIRLHVNSHATVKEFCCKICPKSYTERRGVIRHLRRRHPLQKFDKKLNNFFKRLDPWDSDVKLDVDTMVSIFGPKKEVQEPETDDECRVEIERLRQCQKRIKDDESSDDSTAKPKKRKKKITKNNRPKKKMKRQKIAEVKIKREIRESPEGSPIPEETEEYDVKPQLSEIKAEDEIVPADFVYVKIEPADYDSANEFYA